MLTFPETVQKSKYLVFTMEMLLPVLIILAVSGGAWATFRSRLFSISRINCTLDFQPCPEGAVKAELEKYIGVNLLTLNTTSIESRLTAGDFTIREAVFHKKLPGTLDVELQSVFPVAAIRVKGVENEWLILDAANRVIGLRNIDPNVPTILVSSPLQIHAGAKLEDLAIVKALEFGSEIAKEIYTVRTISLEGINLRLVLEGGKTALMTTEKDSLSQIRLLQAILADTTMSNEVRTIDVRFSKPVLESN